MIEPSMVVIYQPQEVLDECRALEQETLDNLAAQGKLGNNPTGLELPGRFYNGYRGEFGVAQWLRDTKQGFAHHINPNGYGQPNEFLVTAGKGLVRLEVKCASDPSYRWLCIPTQGQDVSKLDIVVGTQVEDKHLIRVRGWLPQRELWDNMVERQLLVPTWTWEWDKLRRMSQLARMLDLINERWETYKAQTLEATDD